MLRLYPDEDEVIPSPSPADAEEVIMSMSRRPCLG